MSTGMIIHTIMTIHTVMGTITTITVITTTTSWRPRSPGAHSRTPSRALIHLLRIVR